MRGLECRGVRADEGEQARSENRGPLKQDGRRQTVEHEMLITMIELPARALRLVRAQRFDLFCDERLVFDRAERFEFDVELREVLGRETPQRKRQQDAAPKRRRPAAE